MMKESGGEKSLMKYVVFVGPSQSVMVDVERCLGFRNCTFTFLMMEIS